MIQTTYKFLQTTYFNNLLIPVKRSYTGLHIGERFCPRSIESGAHNERLTFLILETAVFSRLSAEITTQLPPGSCWQCYAKAPANYFPRGNTPKVSRHTSPIRELTDEEFDEQKRVLEIIAHVRLVAHMRSQ